MNKQQYQGRPTLPEQSAVRMAAKSFERDSPIEKKVLKRAEINTKPLSYDNQQNIESTLILEDLEPLTLTKFRFDSNSFL